MPPCPLGTRAGSVRHRVSFRNAGVEDAREEALTGMRFFVRSATEVTMLRLLALLLLLGARAALAHPVAQGAMDIVIREDRLEVRARVANEQAFVAEALSSPAPGAGDGLEQLWASHGQYLLAHLHVHADGVAVPGELRGYTAPESTGLEGRITFQLEFRFPGTVRRPARVELTQNVLNEFQYAPGNRWEATYVVQIGQAGGQQQEGLLFTSRAPLAYHCDWSAAAPTGGKTLDRGAMFRAYLRHGVMHILTGYDHLLFMSALVLAVISLGDLIKVVTAFTLAHTITLTLSVLEWVRLPSHLVEPMIAASIVVVALQNIFWPGQTRGWSRLLIAFGFGLFHGLGFAGGLLEAMTDLPGIAVAIAIVAFSIGVELGHQVVVLPIFAALQIGRRFIPPRDGADPIRSYALKLGSGAVCLAGICYLVAALRGGG
jgi:hydrogenase/urease accessory protein HupE